MSEAPDYLQLADWRRRMARLYADVRAAPAAGRLIAWNEWRAARNDLFKNHAQSPLAPPQRSNFGALAYFAYDPAWRFSATLEADPDGRTFHYRLGADGDFTMKRIGDVAFVVADAEIKLAVFWIEGYGGGLFLPFRDTTNRDATYGGGRYLSDTIKGADLGLSGDRLVLDFNYAYNPSCAYHPSWACPLAPPENSLSFPVTAGEKLFSAAGDQW